MGAHYGTIYAVACARSSEPCRCAWLLHALRCIIIAWFSKAAHCRVADLYFTVDTGARFCHVPQVLRDGKLVSDLPSRELVPGDIVEVSAGDRIPADLRLLTLKTATLRIEQSSLTGESVAVAKGTEAVADADCELQAKECMLFAATAVANGAGVGVVASTGMRTEIGKIQAQIQEAAKVRTGIGWLSVRGVFDCFGTCRL